MRTFSPRRFAACGMLLCMVIFVGLLLWIRHRHPPITRARFNQLQPGDTRDEVQSLLGAPGNRARSRATIWVPNGDSQVCAFLPRNSIVDIFPDDPPVSNELLWLDEHGLIAVSFDAEGRLQEKYFSTVSTPDGPSIAGWITSRLSLVP